MITRPRTPHQRSTMRNVAQTCVVGMMRQMSRELREYHRGGQEAEALWRSARAVAEANHDTAGMASADLHLAEAEALTDGFGLGARLMLHLAQLLRDHYDRIGA